MKEENSTKYTEEDLSSTIWAPLVRKVLALKKNMIRLKTGESVNIYSSLMKKASYESSACIGAKIDCRFIVDIGKNEIDVSAGEVAMSDGYDDKVYATDEGKLTREGKDVVDGLIEHCVFETPVNLRGCILQIKGFTGEFSTVHLSQRGVYCAVHRETLNFPRNIYDLDQFVSTLETLITIVVSMEDMAVKLVRTSNYFSHRKTAPGKPFGRQLSQVEEKEDFSSW